MTAIKFENVSKRYRRGSAREGLREAVANWFGRLATGSLKDHSQDEYIWALRDVSFDVGRGETLGIIGRNGAGKTTILKLLSRITGPTSGAACVNGRTSALIELGAGFHPDLTGRENIYLNASILGMKGREIHERLDDIISFAELEAFIDTPVKRYSSGMYARLGFSVAVHVDPDVLLVDEVLSVGDIMFQEKCFRRIQEFQAAGKSIVFVSHNLVWVQKICSTAIWLEKGMIAAQGDPQQVVNSYLYHYSKAKPADVELQPGEIPLRYGTGDAEIERVRLLDVEGVERDTFESGEGVVVQIDYRAKSRLEQVNFLLIVTNGEGLKLCGTDLLKEGFDGLTSIDGEGSVRCLFPCLPLRPGTYSLIVIIEGPDATLDQLGGVGPLVIKPVEGASYVDPWRYGIVETPACWTVDVSAAGSYPRSRAGSGG